LSLESQDGRHRPSREKAKRGARDDDAADIQQAFDLPITSKPDRRDGYALLEAGRYESALRVFKREGDTAGLLQLGEDLLSRDGREALAEEAFVAAGRTDKLVEIGDRFAAEGLRDAAVRMYAAANAWEKLAALQHEIEDREV
jgi:hypothetical protein